MNPDNRPVFDPIKEEKRAQLEILRKKMVNDKELPNRSSNLIFGDGSLTAQVFFVGESPGFMEDQQKKPFVGQTGAILDKMFSLSGIPRREGYFTFIIKRKSPEKRDATPEQIELYRPYLMSQIEIIKPKIIVPLGSFALSFFAPLGKIKRDHGKPQQLENGLTIFPLFNPAAALRAGAVMKQLETDFLALGKLLGIAPPVRQSPFGAPPPAPVAPPPPPPLKEPEPEQTKLF